jgi:ribosomal protein S27AE
MYHSRKIKLSSQSGEIVPVENIACGECGTTVSFNLDSDVEEFGTGDNGLIVKEKGSGGVIASPNYTNTGVEKKRCPNCDGVWVSVLTEGGFTEAKDELDIDDGEAVIKIKFGETIRSP